jgi:hypothetical protein
MSCCLPCAGCNETAARQQHYVLLILVVGPSILYDRYELTNKYVEVAVQFIDTFQIVPQHVSTIHCHHQGVV